MKKLTISSLLVIFGLMLTPSVHAFQITVPSATQYGQVLIGQSTGNYTPVATSTLGIVSGTSISAASSTILYQNNTTTTGNTGLVYTGTNVGIGTVSPAAKLDTFGTTFVGDGSRSSSSYGPWPFYISSGNDLGWKVADSGGTSKFEFYAGYGGTNEMRTLNGVDIAGYSDVGSTQKFLLDGAGVSSYMLGKLGIGTTSPWATLSVSTASQLAGTLPLFTVASTTGASLITVNGGGFVGIGTSSSPLTRLVVPGFGTTTTVVFGGISSPVPGLNNEIFGNGSFITNPATVSNYTLIGANITDVDSANKDGQTLIGAGIVQNSNGGGTTLVGAGIHNTGYASTIIGSSNSNSTSFGLIIGSNNSISGGAIGAIGWDATPSNAGSFLIGNGPNFNSENNNELAFAPGAFLSATDGVSFRLSAHDSADYTTQSTFRIASNWIDPTDATRRARTIFYNYDTSAHEFMRVDATSSMQVVSFNGGPVGIGTTSPYSTLSVKGSSDLGNSALAGYFVGTTTATSTLAGGLSVKGTISGANVIIDSTLSFASSGGAIVMAGGGSSIRSGAYAGGGDQFLCVDNTGLFGVVGGSCTPSSLRYKHNINTLTIDSLSTLNALRPVSFEYNAGKGTPGTKWGFIAEEVYKISPSLAVLNKAGTPETLDDRGIMAVVVKALQTLIARVTGLEHTLQVQQQEINSLTARLNQAGIK